MSYLLTPASALTALGATHQTKKDSFPGSTGMSFVGSQTEGKELITKHPARLGSLLIDVLMNRSRRLRKSSQSIFFLLIHHDWQSHRQGLQRLLRQPYSLYTPSHTGCGLRPSTCPVCNISSSCDINSHLKKPEIFLCLNPEIPIVSGISETL